MGEGGDAFVYGGLDLSKLDETTPAEAEAFSAFYASRYGHRHRGLDFLLRNRPDALKRLRFFIRVGYDLPEADERPFVFGYLTYYALLGYEVGVRYLVRSMQTRGLAREHCLDAIAIAFLNVGPRGAETIARALEDYQWITPEKLVDVPSAWDPDLAVLRAGLDFSSSVLSEGDLRRLLGWYRQWVGEVPPHVQFLAKHSPSVLKAYRSRYENCLRTLPKQALPLTLLQVDLILGRTAGVRENARLARAFGVTRDQLLRTIIAGLEFGNLSIFAELEEAIGDLLSD